MFAGLASPSHLILVLVLVLLLFGAKRIPELAKGFGTGIKELREGISTGDSTEREASETEDAHSVGVRAGAGNDTVRTHAGQSQYPREPDP
jgi:sec-independent protein translocase protein TatA